jgi:hypothetical protein
MYKILIAGSRGFTDYLKFKGYVDKFLSSLDKKDIMIIEGGAKGTDHMAHQYAVEKNIDVKTYPADWETHGKKAGMIRNREMGEAATHAIIFWDGQSRGTKNMISICEELGISLRTVRVKLDEHTRKDNQSPGGSIE